MKTSLQLARILIILLSGFILSFESIAAETYTPLVPLKGPTLVKVIPPGQPAAPTQKGVIAKVIWVKGDFKDMAADSKTRTLAKGDGIFLHDTLITGANTEAQIVFTDDTLMTFRPESNFYVSNYTYNPNAPKGGSAGTYVMNLVEGGFRTITGLIAKANPSDYKVNTPVATIGVRGTDYAVYLKDGQLFMGYYKGSPCVTSKNQTLCLDQNTPYARVPSANSVPIPLTQAPPELGGKLDITSITFAAFTSSGGGTPPGSGGITPVGGSGGINGIFNSFCIGGGG